MMDRFVLACDDCRLQFAVSWNHRQQIQRQEFEPDFRLGATRYYSDDFAADVAFTSTAEFLRAKNRFTIGVIPSFEPESDSSYVEQNAELGALIATDRTYYLNFLCISRINIISPVIGHY